MAQWLGVAVILILISCNCTHGLLQIEHGYIDESFVLENNMIKQTSLFKSMFKGSEIMFKIHCGCKKECKNDKPAFAISFRLLFDKCQNPNRAVTKEIYNVESSEIISATFNCSSNIVVSQEILKKIYLKENELSHGESQMKNKTMTQRNTESATIPANTESVINDATTANDVTESAADITTSKTSPNSESVTNDAKKDSVATESATDSTSSKTSPNSESIINNAKTGNVATENATESATDTATMKTSPNSDSSGTTKKSSTYRTTKKNVATKKDSTTKTDISTPLKSNSNTSTGRGRKRRDAEKPKEVTKKQAPHQAIVGVNKIPLTPYKGLYTFNLTFKSLTDDELTFQVHIQSTSGGSYLSALNWPMLPFYGFMSLLYLVFALGWFVASCCNWKDLLRLQFWIGGIVAIGMFENALFYAEYQSISHTGSENGLLYFAELVSCAKRALARILVIIVSMGFGIVKPRLGQTLHKVLAVGTIYFVLAAIEGCIRVHDGGLMRTKSQTYSLIPVTLLDVGLSWWVFTSLVQTTRTLRIRKNLIKLTLYNHFTNTLIFTVIASLAYLVWSIKELRFSKCLNISTIWLQEALWPFLFAIILAVVMILWRPSNNNQRYAFTPLLLGESDNEDDDMTLSDAFEGMKMRNKADVVANGSKNRNKAEDDLKWVEENIPSVPSTLLPTIDSDEEILTTKFEMSKMD